MNLCLSTGGKSESSAQQLGLLHAFFFHNHIIGAGVYPNLSL